MKNLVIVVAGDSSLHKTWTSGSKPEFDLFVVYYGDMGDRYRKDGMYYDFAKGTKFLIVDAMIEKHKDLFDHYDAILIPDDDMFFDATGINKFFSIFHQYNLMVAQPAIMGWQSLLKTAPNFETILRYVRCVEIMTPCFSKEAFNICKSTFKENKTNWGIDWLWYNLLGEPKDKMAVIDDVVAVHTRPCFFGDTYWRNDNNFGICVKEINALFEKYKIDGVNVEFGSVPRDMKEWIDRPSEHKLFPNCPAIANIIRSRTVDSIL
jgi:hypothetical protein